MSVIIIRTEKKNDHIEIELSMVKIWFQTKTEWASNWFSVKENRREPILLQLEKHWTEPILLVYQLNQTVFLTEWDFSNVALCIQKQKQNPLDSIILSFSSSAKLNIYITSFVVWTRFSFQLKKITTLKVWTCINFLVNSDIEPYMNSNKRTRKIVFNKLNAHLPYMNSTFADGAFWRKKSTYLPCKDDWYFFTFNDFKLQKEGIATISAFFNISGTKKRI
jgi:hypothetical protein